MGKIKYLSFLLFFIFLLSFDVKPALAETIACTPGVGYDACFISSKGNTATTIQTSSNPSQFKSCSVGWCVAKQYKITYKCSGSGGEVITPFSRTISAYGSEDSFSCSEKSCSGTILKTQTTEFDESMDPGDVVAFTSPHAITPYTIQCLFNPETDNNGDFWAYQAVGYNTWPSHYVVNCVDDSDCPLDNVCDNSGNWDTWQCVSTSLPAPLSGEVLDQQQSSKTKSAAAIIGTNGRDAYAQTFIPGGSGNLNRVAFNIVSMTGSGGTLRVGISPTDQSGNLSGQPTNEVLIPQSSLTLGIRVVTFSPPPLLIGGQKYALRFSNDIPAGGSSSINLEGYDNCLGCDYYLPGKLLSFYQSLWQSNTGADLFFGTYMTNYTTPTPTPTGGPTSTPTSTSTSPYIKNTTLTCPSSPCIKTQADIPFNSDHLYYIAGNLDISDENNGIGSGVVIVDGNLNITGNYCYGAADCLASTPPNGIIGTVFIVKGDINITQNVTRVDAVLISQGTICTAFDGISCPSGFTDPATTSQLVINGSLISLNPDKPIKFRRTLSDNSQPAEVINHQVKYLVILRDLLSDTWQKWSEIP